MTSDAALAKTMMKTEEGIAAGRGDGTCLALSLAGLMAEGEATMQISIEAGIAEGTRMFLLGVIGFLWSLAHHHPPATTPPADVRRALRELEKTKTSFVGQDPQAPVFKEQSDSAARKNQMSSFSPEASVRHPML
jgi:hypothetical protein